MSAEGGIINETYNQILNTLIFEYLCVESVLKSKKRYLNEY